MTGNDLPSSSAGVLAGEGGGDEIEAIRRRVDAATPGPWHVEQDQLSWGLYGVRGFIPPFGRNPGQTVYTQILRAQKAGQRTFWPKQADGQFIAAARTDVPTLLLAIDETRRAHEQTKTEYEQLCKKVVAALDAQNSASGLIPPLLVLRRTLAGGPDHCGLCGSRDCPGSGVGSCTADIESTEPHRPTAYLPAFSMSGEMCRACDEQWPCETARIRHHRGGRDRALMSERCANWVEGCTRAGCGCCCHTDPKIGYP